MRFRSFITLGIGIVLDFELRAVRVKLIMPLTVLAWVVLFSALNAFSEEAIFRLGVVAPLYGQLSGPVIALVSAGLFGVPHYFGMPRGIVGVLMAGFLGWLLALSLLETHGLLIAWAIHFVQDVVIIASLFLMRRVPGPAVPTARS